MILFTRGGGGAGIPACIAGGIPACLAAGLGGRVGGFWYPSMPCRFPGPHPGGKFRGIWLGVQAHTQGGKLRGILKGESAPGGMCSPLGWLLLWAVRILLGCILVYNLFLQGRGGGGAVGSMVPSPAGSATEYNPM